MPDQPERRIARFNRLCRWVALLAPVGVALSTVQQGPAVWMWAGLLGICAWGSAVLAGEFYAACRGVPGRGQGLLTLLVATSPLACRAIRGGSISPAVALAIAGLMYDLVKAPAAREALDRQRLHPSPLTTAAALAMLAGFFARYATLVLIPLHLLIRRRTVLTLAATLMVPTLVIFWVFAGDAQFAQFVTQDLLTMASPDPSPTSQSMAGFVMRITGVDALSGLPRLALLTGQLATLGVAFLVLWGVRARLAEPATMLAGGASLVAWLLIFGPLNRDYDAMCLSVFWGWLLAAGRGNAILTTLGIVAIALLYVPFPAFAWFKAPEPVNSHMLWGAWLVLGLAACGLLRPGSALRCG